MFLLSLLTLMSFLSIRRSIWHIRRDLICNFSLSYEKTETGDSARRELPARLRKSKARRGKEEEKDHRKRADWVSGAEGRGVGDLWYKRRAWGTQKLLVRDRRGIIDCEHRHPAQPITELHTDLSALQHLHFGEEGKMNKRYVMEKREEEKQSLKMGWRA